ncbi:rab11 family-interacting protein 3 isoform X4 [Podarcis raffonei]|uniref:rab11 family-interacting protein 3 isoform X4 n=1 Tax=Podarcis raffonei TaxID=65483 RepID=UPI0023292082|nr:rab11 family-interacting protein 3 isoform X4 [Podarcis raffonei]
MKMDPDLLMTLSDPGTKPDREPLLTLGPLQNGKYLLLEQKRGPALPSPELVLLSRETTAGNTALILPGTGDIKKPLALERVLNGMKLGEMERRQALFPDGPLEFLYRVEKEPEEVDREAQGPISDGETGSGVGHNSNPDSPGEGLDLRLAPVRDGLALEESTALREEEQLVSCSSSQAESPVPQDLQPVVEEWREGDPFPQPQEPVEGGEPLILAGEPSQEEEEEEEGPLDRGLPSPPWTKDMDSCDSQKCPQSPLLRPLDLALAPPIGTGVDLFPAFHSPNNLSPHLEFGHTEHIEDESPSSPDDAPRLRAVFDALDRDGDGFVRIEEFVQFATVYGAEQVKDLTKFLDPAGLGVISFEDFYRGISAIRNGAVPDSQLCTMGYAHDEPPSACPDEFDDFVTFEANEVTDSAYMGSESTYSECETFTDEDTSTLVHHEMHDEVETDSAIDSTVHSEFTDPIEEPENGSHPHDLPLTSDINNHSIVTVISGEEHFEDYGEGNEVDLFSDSLCNGESGFSSSSFLSPSTNPLAAKLHSIITDEAFEFYCTQCHKQINRLEDLSARLNDLEMNRHLHQTGTLPLDVMEEPFRNNTECLEEDITDKVIFLEKRVTELEKDTVANGEQHSRLKQENLQLVHRANALEEQLKEQELKSDEVLMDEIRKQRDLLSKMEREKSIEIENLQARIQQLDDENGELRSCVPCLRANIERLEEEKQKLLDEIEDLTMQLNEEQENKRKLGDKLTHERHQFQKDKESTQELIEDLRKQLEHLQLFKLEAEQRRGRSSSIGLQEYNSRTRETELEQEIRRLKQDNRNLKEQNDELNGQIINLSIQGAKNLFSASFSESLAAEISSVSRDEVLWEGLRETLGTTFLSAVKVKLNSYEREIKSVVVKFCSQNSNLSILWVF